MKGREWLDYHLETFVKPNNLGVIPPPILPAAVYCDALHQWAKYMDVFFKCWKEAKTLATFVGLPLLFAGRDAWEFEILARMEGFPSRFMPQISSDTKNRFAPATGVEDLRDYVLIDSGSSGSIPKALGCKYWRLVYFGGYNKEYPRGLHQLLYTPDFDKPGFSGYPYNNPMYNQLSGLYGALETSPKYWRRATGMDMRYPIAQGFDMNQFSHAASVTQIIANEWLQRHG